MNEIITTESYCHAVRLNEEILYAADQTQQSLYRMCTLLKEMRDGKLYKELGYHSFEDYCENEVGMNRRNAYRYIAVIENIKNVTSMSQIGMTKLSLLASLSESQQEEIQQKVDVEDVSVRELKEEIDKLRKEKSAAEVRLKIARQQVQDENSDKQLLKQKADELKNENNRLTNELTDMKEQNRQLQSAKTPDRKTQDALIRQLDRQLSEADQQYANDLERQRKKYQEEINRLTSQLEEQQKIVNVAVETVEVPDMKEVFKAYYKNAISAFNAMIEFVSAQPEKSFFVEKIGSMMERLKDLTGKMEETT